MFGQSQALTSFADQLRRYHVALTKDSLIDALKSPVPDVRWLAAQKLAEDNVKEAVPFILEALRKDSALPQNEANLAAALAKLGSEQGYKTLTAMCNNRENAPDVRLVAARYLADFGKPDCLDSTVDILNSQSDDGLRIEALRLLPRLAANSDVARHRVDSIVARLLVDPSPSVRLNAAITLADLGDSNAISDLRGAIATEKEAAIRSQMQSALSALEQKHR